MVIFYDAQLMCLVTSDERGKHCASGKHHAILNINRSLHTTPSILKVAEGSRQHI